MSRHSISERPILFSGNMVRAILDGRKTQTRRVVKPQPTMCEARCPYGQPGDRLWVKETFRLRCETELLDVVEYRADLARRTAGHQISENAGFRFSAECDEAERQPEEFGYMPGALNWRPSIFMPRWASRITLEIVSVRVERLQDISPLDIIAEGMDHLGEHQHLGDLQWYRDVWESTYGPGAWEKNDLVWALTFKKMT